MTPRRPRLGEPTHVWLISDATGTPRSIRLVPTIEIDAFIVGWSAKKVELQGAVHALAEVQYPHVKPKRSIRKRASDVLSALWALLAGGGAR